MKDPRKEVTEEDPLPKRTPLPHWKRLNGEPGFIPRHTSLYPAELAKRKLLAFISRARDPDLHRPIGRGSKVEEINPAEKHVDPDSIEKVPDLVRDLPSFTGVLRDLYS